MEVGTSKTLKSKFCIKTLFWLEIKKYAAKQLCVYLLTVVITPLTTF